mgnify:CR=1 FL=1
MWGIRRSASRRYQATTGPSRRLVCLFSIEIIEALQKEGHPIFPGSTGENLSIQFWVSNGTGTEHTIEWVFYEINGGVEGPYTQNVTLDSSGYGTFVWESDVSSWSEGSYALAISINSMYYKWFYFDVGCSGCGYDSSLIGAEYEVWSQAFGTIFASWNETNTSSNSANDDTPVVYIGDSLGTWVQVSCLVYGEEYWHTRLQR